MSLIILTVITFIIFHWVRMKKITSAANHLDLGSFGLNVKLKMRENFKCLLFPVKNEINIFEVLV